MLTHEPRDGALSVEVVVSRTRTADGGERTCTLRYDGITKICVTQPNPRRAWRRVCLWRGVAGTVVYGESVVWSDSPDVAEA